MQNRRIAYLNYQQQWRKKVSAIISATGPELMVEIKRALDEMHIGSETRVLLRVQNDSLLLTPVRVGIPDDELDEIMDDIEERFGETFKSLAK